MPREIDYNQINIDVLLEEADDIIDFNNNFKKIKPKKKFDDENGISKKSRKSNKKRVEKNKLKDDL